MWSQPRPAHTNADTSRLRDRALPSLCSHPSIPTEHWKTTGDHFTCPDLVYSVVPSVAVVEKVQTRLREQADFSLSAYLSYSGYCFREKGGVNQGGVQVWKDL